MRAAVALLASVTLGGCTLITESFATNEFSGDKFPTYVDTRSGAVLVGLRSGDERHTAVIDVLSPLTLIDPGPEAEATVDLEDLTLVGDAPGGNAGMYTTPRAAFSAQQVLRVHPCSVADPQCMLGLPSGLVGFSAIVGADALAGDALRLRVGDNQVYVLADVGGTNADRTHACDAVFPSPFRGGGTLVVAGTEVPFAGRRVTMQACLAADASLDRKQLDRGTDVMFAVSTSIGPSLLSESAYERYRQWRVVEIEPTIPRVEDLPEVALALPSGPITGHLTTIPNIALVARASSDSLAPCRQFYAHHLMTARTCFASDDCPCEDGATFCPVPATLDLHPDGGVPVVIVPDDDPTLQALRTEFRPSIQEIDGILGTGVMRDIELDIDYPHSRVLARCANDDFERCVTRPAIDGRGDLEQIRACPFVVSRGAIPGP